MKQFLPLAFMAAILVVGSAKANQLTCNNNTTSPGQYTNLQTAINAAKPGDTILVSGSSIDYAANGTINIRSPVTLFGTGYNPIKDAPTTSTISYINLSAGSSGTVIVGFSIFNLSSDGSVDITNITIRRNSFYGSCCGDGGLNDANGDNWVIQENLFSRTGLAINGNNIAIKNNVFSSDPYRTIANTSGNTNLIFSNNIVFDAAGQNGSITFYNGLVSNNIFYDSTGNDVVYFSNTSSTIFSNNIVYNNPDVNPLNIGNNSNTGSGNKLNTNPKFTSLSLYSDPNWGAPDAFNLSSNLSLQTTSIGHNAGTDGKDIGLYGGGGAQNPLTGTPPIPQISTMNILTTTVAPGGTLSVQIKAKTGN